MTADKERTSYALERFMSAQAPVYETALAELRAGEKRTHWMWFIFPQVQGLGSSSMAVRYAISGRDEARAYLNHPVLGPRLMACTQAVVALSERTVEQIFGYPDDLKFRSSMTLFAEVAEPGSVFRVALERFFAGEADQATLTHLR